MLNSNSVMRKVGTASLAFVVLFHCSCLVREFSFVVLEELMRGLFSVSWIKMRTLKK